MNLNSVFSIILISIFVFIILGLLCIFFIGETIPANDNISFPDDVDMLDLDDLVQYMEVINNLYGRYPSYLFNVRSKTDYCILYLCGFNTTTNEGFDVIQKIATKTNHMAFIPQLPGQSVYNEESSYNGITVYDYLKYIYLICFQIKKQNKKIILISSSTGCSYAIWLTNRFGEFFNIEHSFMLSPNIEPAGIGSFLSKLCLLPCGSFFIKLLKYKIFINNDTLNTSIFYNLLGILGIVRRIKFYENNTPITIFLNKNDKVISAKKCIEYYNNYKGKKEIHFVDTDEHNIITVEKLKDEITTTIISSLPQ